MTQAEDGPILEIVFNATATKISFIKWQELKDWIESEAQYWSWLSNPPVSNDPIWGQFARQWINAINQLRGQAANPDLQKEDASTASARETLKQAGFNYGQKAIPSNSPFAQYTKELETDEGYGPIVAVSALASYLKVAFVGDIATLLKDPRKQRGAILATLFSEGVNSKSVKALKRSIETVERDAITTFSQRQIEIQEIKESGNSAISKFSAESSEAILAANAGFEDSKTQSESQFQALNAELTNVKVQYEEFMGLKAPVTYWKNRASTHGKRLRNFTVVLAVASVLSSILLLGIYIWIFDNVSGRPEIDHIVYLGAGIISTTVALWLNRVFLKIVLSERHLKNMAEEKSVLIETYLAMTKVEGASKEDRHIVLSSIFNTSSDGIVKDDGASDASLSLVLSRLLVPK